ncbi:MAG: lipid-A-disaccharide synthase [Betaproteobacteria bacterium]|nr:MAG: lipid-A-disaccharide synthase [Betaproteobacteria bacterium]
MNELVNRRLRVAMLAGEASGDLLGSHLLAALKSRFPHLSAFGIGGPKMQQQGLDVWYPMEQLAVRGYVEVLRSLPKLLRLRGELKRRLIRERPDIFIGIDSPDFNLELERKLRSAGITTVQYVSPTIWAWRGERIHKIKRAVDKVLALFPFEAPIYQRAGIPVAYVGHPLADELPEFPDHEGTREQLKIPSGVSVVALLPGSRQSEVRQMSELMIATALRIREQIPDVHFLVPLVSRETRTIFEDALYQQDAEDLPLTILFGHAHEAMTAADTTLVASGTATLEAALLKCAMVVTYTMPALSAWIMRRKGYLPYVGLPNIIAGEFIVPELLQEDALPENLAQAVCNLLRSPRLRARLQERFHSMHMDLRQGTAERAVDALEPLLAAKVNNR